MGDLTTDEIPPSVATAPPFGPSTGLSTDAPPFHLTVAPLTPSPSLEVLTKEVEETQGGDLAALIGGAVGAVLLLFICVLALLLWCLSRHKGSYITNEMDEDEDEEDIVNNADFDESDVELQTREPLRVTEEE